MKKFSVGRASWTLTGSAWRMIDEEEYLSISQGMLSNSERGLSFRPGDYPRVHGPRHVIHGTGSNQYDEYTAFVYLADGDNYVYRAAMLTAHFLPLLHHYMYVKALVQVRTSPTSKGVKSTKKNGMTATGK